jgi:hypothetical protein
MDRGPRDGLQRNRPSRAKELGHDVPVQIPEMETIRKVGRTLLPTPAPKGLEGDQANQGRPPEALRSRS